MMRMPGRNRRVRLVAIAACVTTVFFLYERNAGAAYLSPSTVGGGAVLRKPEDDPHAYVPPQRPAITDDRPAVYTPPEPEAWIEPDVINPEPQPAATRKPTTTSTSTAAGEEHEATTEAIAVKEKAPVPTLPPKPYSSPAPVHWSKPKEHWPITSTIQLPPGTPLPIPRIQSAKKGADPDRLRAIKDATKHAWQGYRDIGWGYDEVSPVSGVGKNSFNGWGATLVDSLDTLWIMGLKDEFEDAVNQTSYIDFTTSSRNDIPLFEVTIRYLGGLIAAYDVSGHQYRILLDKAVELAEILYSAFDTPNRMPDTYYKWKPAFASNGHRASTRVVLAELGTLSLEFTRLAQITKEPKYYDAIARITDAFEEWQNKTRMPGMWPISVDASGCAKPVAIAPSNTYNQAPVPGGDTYMMASEPVQASRDATKKAEAALASADEEFPSLKQGSAGLDSMGRHREGFTGDPSVDVPNLKQASAELDSYVTSEADILKKRQLDDDEQVDDLVDPRVSPKVGSSPTPDYNRSPPVPQAPGNVAPPGSLNDVPAYKEPECVPQGLQSPSMNGAETFTMGGQSDSVYEYLPKEWLLLGGQVEQYKTMYLDSMVPTIDKLMFRPMTPGNLDILISGEVMVQKNYTSEEWYETHTPKGEHLTCFIGGMLAMGGKIFKKPEHVEIGRKLTDGCIWAYNSTASGIMPESFLASPCASKTDCQWNETEWHDSLDPYKAYRDEQRATWVEQYGEQALLDWKPPEPVTYQPGVGAPRGPNFADSGAAKAPKNRLPESLVYADNGHPTTNTKDSDITQAKDTSSFGTVEGAKAAGVDTTPEEAMERKDSSSFGDLNKRSMDDAEPPLAAPQPQVLPTKASFPTEEDESVVKSSFAEDSANSPDVAPPVPIYAPSTTYGDTDYQDDDIYVPPAAPIYTPAPPPTHEEFVKQKIEDERLPPGFSRYDSKKYILRPEAIESVFYMYRITGEQHWRDAGWEMFKAVEGLTRVEFGHSAIDDISKTHPEHLDGMESFWIAETLKYFYLLFDEEDSWSLDDWVLNTEAHFFKRPA